MSLTPQDKAAILEHYRRSRSPFKTATALGFELSDVWELINESEHLLHARQERHGGYGRPEMVRFTVARRRAGTGWNNAAPELRRARRQYEEGTVELATGRDGLWEILYAIPRKRPQPRPHYFKLGV
ncbi:hypothetical protein KNJ79_05455 [Sphingopyxis indica]|uniref:hypothetical protein n=1 Tax=Sphingopyxis indica TaxID=436663 RepID=UPI002938DA58|nr:hypothetical protein [Sphingopyxis indica]WOF44380.1 hypothetical protein KNJ79_05455 [Sphingopyxis indica]